MPVRSAGDVTQSARGCESRDIGLRELGFETTDRADQSPVIVVDVLDDLCRFPAVEAAGCDPEFEREKGLLELERIDPLAVGELPAQPFPAATARSIGICTFCT